MQAQQHIRRRTRWGLALTAVGALGVSMLGTPAALAAITEPPPLPFVVTIFPQRDFVSAEWDNSGKPLTFDVTRSSVNVGHAASVQGNAALPTILTDADGILEVNHPGGLCWDNATPDILPGDKVTIVESGTANGVAATTLNITADPAVLDPATGDVVIHGVAKNLNGTPMDLGFVEQRIISPGNLFDVNGKRDIRATSDGGSLGLITADPAVDGGWTATYHGLSAADQDRATSGETRGMAWQSVNAAGDRLGITIYEADLTGGPGMPECPAQASNSVTGASPTSVNAGNVGGGLALSGASFNASSVTVTLDDSNPATGSLTATATPTSAVGAGSYTVSFAGPQLTGLSDGNLTATSSFVTTAGTVAGSGMAVLKDTVVPLPPTSDTAPGRYASAQSIRLSRAAGEAASSVVHFTTDGSVPNADSPTAQPVAVTSTRTIRAVVVDAAGNVSSAADFAYTIGAAAATPPAGSPASPPAGPPAGSPAGPPGAGAGAVIPLAPRIADATSGKRGGAHTATARWRVPLVNGAVRNGYEVRALKLRPGHAAKVHPAVVVGANAAKVKLTLPAGRYQFQVRATSVAGKSPWSDLSNKVTAR